MAKNQNSKERVCAITGCGTILSKYNPDPFCRRHPLNVIEAWQKEQEQKKASFNSCPAK